MIAAGTITVVASLLLSGPGSIAVFLLGVSLLAFGLGERSAKAEGR